MSNGCGKCWEEFKGWLKAFTPIESLLTILEAVLLVLLLAFLVFLILHFLACQSEEHKVSSLSSTTKTVRHSKERLTGKSKRPTCTYSVPGMSSLAEANLSETLSKPSEASSESEEVIHSNLVSLTGNKTANTLVKDLIDGEDASDDERQLVLALVRIKPSGLTFGCILTVVSEYWTVTAASCIDAIEEVDSLDNFVILDNYDEARGTTHAVSEVRVHPLYEGRNKSYDLGLLKSEDRLQRKPVLLASLLNYHRMTIGQKAYILGFGHFRTIDHSASGKRIHSAAVHVLPSKNCVEKPPEFGERHLLPLAPVSHGRCGVRPMCLGVLYSRGTPCNFCAGAPLLQGNVLLGVMADNEQCGVACEPALYANMAAAASWLAAVLAT